jgi:hypothetical protein
MRSGLDEVVKKIPCSRLVFTAARLFILIRIAGLLRSYRPYTDLPPSSACSSSFKNHVVFSFSDMSELVSALSQLLFILKSDEALELTLP